MKTKIWIIIPLIYTLIFSCRESGADNSNPVTPRDSCIVLDYIKDSHSIIYAYNKFDSVPGFAYATKVNKTTYFTAMSFLKFGSMILLLASRDDSSHRITDDIVFADFLPVPGCYSFNVIEEMTKIDGVPTSYFSNNDGDVVVDSYILDTSRADNRLEIISIDTVNKIIEGRFACSFVFANDRPKRSRYNLDTMRFFNGYFKGKYQVR